MLIARASQSISPHGDQWIADGRTYFASGAITIDGRRWYQSGSRWMLENEPLTYFEQRPQGWSEWVQGEQVGEIIYRGDDVVYRRGPRVIVTYSRLQDGSLRRQQDISMPPPPRRTPSQFEKRLIPSQLDNP